VLPGISDNRLQLKFTPQVVSGLAYTVQASSDLNEWTDIPIPSGGLSVGEPFTFNDTEEIPASGSAKRFLRLHLGFP
jgi:hypothetical protein